MASTKQQRQKNEKAAREKRASLAKEKVLSIRRSILNVVECMLEENISEKWFLENCVKLCQQDYDDVIQERSIEHLCGYPLCDKSISKDIKQQYRISRASNKVYDLTERKCFCCNQCYKASNYLKSQLPDIPLYMRKPGLSIAIHLLTETDNRGAAGEEIVFQHSLLKDPVVEPCVELSVSDILSDILQEEVKGCEEQLANLKITENVYESPYIFGAEDTGTKDPSNVENISNCSEEDFSEEGDDDDDEQTNFPEYNNLSLLTNKHMPIPDRIKKVVLISPIKPTNIPQSSPSTKLSVEFIGSIFRDWFTEDTLKYLLGERRMYSMKADILFQTMISSGTPNSEKLSSIKKEYVNLCLKIDHMQEEEEEELSDSLEIDIESTSGCFRKCETDNSLCNSVKDPLCSKSISEDASAPTHSIPKRRPKRKSKGKNKTVSFAPGVKDAKYISKEKVVIPSEESEINQSVPEPIFPLIDSVSQNALRKQVLTTKLKAVYFDILPVVGLHFKDIREGIMKIVETFSLTPKNIIFKPKEWKCIALVLFRILTKTTLKDPESNEDAQYSKLCEVSKMNLIICTQEIEDLVSDLISSNQLRRFQGSYISK